ncbi:MAG TPA: hypothetical protein ENJ54_04335 [Chloroflexi bacterium]|nr:hypothetical protein [Chloroflexota bacterium]
MSDWDYPFQNSYILNEAQWEEWEPNMHGVPDGVKRGVYGEFEVTPASSGLVVNVAGGVAVVRGFYCRRESAKPLTLQPPDTQNPRIDLVVLRRSISGGGFTRMVITGDPAANPTAPNPAQDNDNLDLPLAEVYVAANAQSLDAGDITDRRVWTSGLDEHLEDASNPHQVTTAQIGAATAADLQAHEGDTNNPHQVTYDQVGAAPASHTLGSHSDVDVSGIANGETLGYDAATEMFVPLSVAGKPTYISGTGTCVRFPSGLQICWVYPIYVVNGTSATWTYPAAFSSSPTVVVSGYRSLMNLYSNPPGTTAVAVYNTSSTARNAGIIAIGKWT